MKKTLFRLCTGISIIALTALLFSCDGLSKGTKSDVAAAKEMLKISFTGSDNIDRVTGKLILETNIGNGVTVTWESSNKSVITANGSVTRAAVNTPVTLTATLKKDKETAIKTFEVTVYGTDQEKADTALATISTLPSSVYGSLTQITLQQQVSVGGSSHSVTWKAEPAGIVNVGTGNVTKPKEKTTVTLTAEITVGKATASTTYMVTVYPEGVTPSAKELLDTITIQKTADEDIPLPQKLGEMVIEWTSSNLASIKIEGNKAVVTKDLVPQTVTLTAKVPGKTAEKNFSVTVPAITEIVESQGENRYKKYEFANNILTTTYKDDREERKREYSITVNAADKIITATLRRSFFGGKWFTLEELKQANIAEAGKYEEMHGKLAVKDVITLQTIRDAFAELGMNENLSDKDFFEHHIKRSFFTEDITYEAFTELSDAERTTQIKEQIERSRLGNIEYLGLSPTATWQEIADKARERMIEDTNKYFEEQKHPQKYRYMLEKIYGSDRFETHSIYNSDKRWFEQNGEYEAKSMPQMNIFKRGPKQIYISIGNEHYDAEYSNDGSFFLAQKQDDPDAPKIKGTVTDKNNGTITVRFKDTNYELTFRGWSLSW